MRKATFEVRRVEHHQFISIPAFREEGDGMGKDVESASAISIPAFREEGDFLTDIW